ncbi:MAG: hypothetical protein J5Y07_10640 [Dehalobacter sp.]|uniref:Uncharacterized protein n=1 Tax=Dehalobacter restrictus (strain DSM 9455 / PER-K23) TaxID=871738 RepID=A0ABN4C0D4_DEHRP|nr:hypothetical protein DEHRE_06950 [Dehalobacter restrictus DSM 9455]MCG1026136.1 hypothetical protein [Dehalobacter sp.]
MTNKERKHCRSRMMAKSRAGFILKEYKTVILKRNEALFGTFQITGV